MLLLKKKKREKSRTLKGCLLCLFVGTHNISVKHMDLFITRGSKPFSLCEHVESQLLKSDLLGPLSDSHTPEEPGVLSVSNHKSDTGGVYVLNLNMDRTYIYSQLHVQVPEAQTCSRRTKRTHTSLCVLDLDDCLNTVSVFLFNVSSIEKNKKQNSVPSRAGQKINREIWV